jgi:DNA-binding LacI/PurR family transcriptional regulator
MRELLSLDPDVTAVFVANDHMALGALSALAEAGRRVPEDVSVVGFDDEPTAVYYRPPLTTVRQPLTDAAERALHRLLGVIRPEAAGTPLPTLVAAELVVRHSTAPPPSR